MLRIALLTCFLSLACRRDGGMISNSSSQGPDQTSISYVRAVDDTVTWQNRQNYRAFTVNVRFHNATERPVYRHWCRAEIQRLINDSWQTVQNTICTAGNPTYHVVAPRDSAAHQVNVYSFPDSAHPHGDRRVVAGVYRLVFEMGYRDDSGQLQTVAAASRTTQPFVVRDP